MNARDVLIALGVLWILAIAIIIIVWARIRRGTR